MRTCAIARGRGRRGLSLRSLKSQKKQKFNEIHHRQCKLSVFTTLPMALVDIAVVLLKGICLVDWTQPPHALQSAHHRHTNIWQILKLQCAILPKYNISPPLCAQVNSENEFSHGHSVFILCERSEHLWVEDKTRTSWALCYR